MPGKNEERKRRAALMEKKNEKEKKIFSLKNFEFFRLIALTVICQLCRTFIAADKRGRE
jgi:hypothetical protein